MCRSSDSLPSFFRRAEISHPFLEAFRTITHRSRLFELSLQFPHLWTGRKSDGDKPLEPGLTIKQTSVSVAMSGFAYSIHAPMGAASALPSVWLHPAFSDVFDIIQSGAFSRSTFADPAYWMITRFSFCTQPTIFLEKRSHTLCRSHSEFKWSPLKNVKHFYQRWSHRYVGPVDERDSCQGER